MEIRSKRKLFFATGVFLAIIGAGLAVGASFVTPSVSCETPVRMVTIRGTVTQRGHPTLGTTYPVHSELLFRKVGCDGCVIGTYINGDTGQYKIRVGEGRYEVSYPDPVAPVEWLAKDQPRFVDTTRNGTEQDDTGVYDFDIVLQTPPSSTPSGDDQF
ncbi:MAG: hypothetical protein LC113_10705 [Acidobacteria bacterium]|nr:hypothetical protein [Acidobacteriota bacterium]